MAINRKSALIAASKIFFQEMGRFGTQGLDKGFHMLMTDKPNELGNFNTFRTQTATSAPIVLINDLNERFKNRGALTVRMYRSDKHRAMPVMGGQEVAGREEQLGQQHRDITVDQSASALRTGSDFEQMVEPFDSMSLLKPALNDWGMSLMSETALYHMAGARGFYEDEDNNLPVQGSAGLDAALVNPLLPPTYTRKLYAGGANSIDGTDAKDTVAITAADTMSLAVIRRVSSHIDRTSGVTPLRPSKLGTGATEGSRPKYIMFLSPAQWDDLISSDGKEVESLMTQSMIRAAGWNHPVFNYEGFMKDGIWVTKNFMPIRFFSGDPVDVCNNDVEATVRTEAVPANVPAVDRAIVIGASALATAYAADTNGTNMRFKVRDIGYDSVGYKASFVSGFQKIRWRTRNGWTFDNGVIAVDTAISKV